MFSQIKEEKRLILHFILALLCVRNVFFAKETSRGSQLFTDSVFRFINVKVVFLYTFQYYFFGLDSMEYFVALLSLAEKLKKFVSHSCLPWRPQSQRKL